MYVLPMAGSLVLRSTRKFHTRLLSGLRPESRLFLDGLHQGKLAYALVKSSELAARASIAGVMVGAPITPRLGRMSSIAMNRILGLPGGAGPVGGGVGGEVGVAGTIDATELQLPDRGLTVEAPIK
jgi:hypothetical protein